MAEHFADERLLIFDDFLTDPHQFRQIGLEAVYPPARDNQYFPGRNSSRRYVIAEIDQQLSGIVAQRLMPKKDSLHCTFRLCLEGEQSKGGVHIDPCHWSGILYLSLPEHCKGGTDFFRHRESGQTRAPVYPEDWRHWKLPRDGFHDAIRRQATDPSKWELTRHIEMKFNRLILFRPWLFHNAGPGFGDRPENGRLIYVLFYNVADGWS